MLISCEKDNVTTPKQLKTVEFRSNTTIQIYDCCNTWGTTPGRETYISFEQGTEITALYYPNYNSTQPVVFEIWQDNVRRYYTNQPSTNGFQFTYIVK